MGTLSERARQKVAGPAWDKLRNQFNRITHAILDVDSNAHGELTTVYVKFTIDSAPDSRVYAVVWVKSSKHLTLGLALPPGSDAVGLGPAPKGMAYRGVTRYITIGPGDRVPEDLPEWAAKAYEAVKSNASHLI